MPPITSWEVFGSREHSDGDDTRTLLKYVLYGSNNQNALREHLRQKTGPVSEDALLVRGDIRVSQIGPLLWSGEVDYASPDQKKKEPKKTGESEYSFDTTQGTTKITHSLATKSYPRDPAELPEDFHGAIHVTGEGKDQRIEGIEIPVPGLTFTETHYLPRNVVTLDYIRILYKNRGKVNNGPWRNFAGGELLFLGARGSVRGNEDYKVDFSFSGSENVESLTSAGIKGIKKGGHQYLWVRSRPEDDEKAGLTVMRPRAVYVETLFYSFDFTLLGIGS